MGSVSVLEFGITYPAVNLELKKNEKEYDRAIIALYIAEIERGFIVKKMNKTTRKGTKVTFKACKGEDEGKEYIEMVNKLIEEFNEKYSTDIGFKLS